MTRQEIVDNLLHGDKQEIARITGVSFSMVRQVLSGDRNCETKTGVIVLQAAKEVIENRNKLQAKYTA